MIRIKVNDISCDHCKMAITKCLKDLEGIEELNVSVEKKEVSFSGNIDTEKVKAGIRDAGYTPEHN